MTPHAIVSAWISPKRREIYSFQAIGLGDGQPHLQDMAHDTCGSIYSNDSLLELFSDAEQNGLWQIVVPVSFHSVVYRTDCGDEYDVEVIYGDPIFKSKCATFAGLMTLWGFYLREQPRFIKNPVFYQAAKEAKNA